LKVFIVTNSHLILFIFFLAFLSSLLSASPSNSTAVIGVSSALPSAQLELAREVSQFIGIPIKEVVTEEGQVPGYIANEGASCFHCKTALYSTLR
jgi:PP-loop superfamily ATP-utilizing enzyme